MIVVGDFYRLAHRHFHPGHGLHFARVSKCFRGGIVGAVGKLNAGSHVVDPRGDELLLYVIIAFDAHAFELHLLHFAVFSRHLHLPGHIHYHVTTAHSALADGSALGLLWRRIRVRIHPHLDGKIPIAVEVREELVVLVELRHLHHLLHHFLRVWRTARSTHSSGRRRRDSRRRGRSLCE